MEALFQGKSLFSLDKVTTTVNIPSWDKCFLSLNTIFPTSPTPSPSTKICPESLMDEARDIVRNILLECEEKNISDWATLKSNVRDELRSYLYEKTKRKPMILPIIMEI